MPQHLHKIVHTKQKTARQLTSSGLLKMERYTTEQHIFVGERKFKNNEDLLFWTLVRVVLENSRMLNVPVDLRFWVEKYRKNGFISSV